MSGRCIEAIYRCASVVFVLELAVLGLLKDQELHGYELKKRLNETLGPLSRVSFGSLYPALRRLSRAGAIEAVEGVTAAEGAEGQEEVPGTGPERAPLGSHTTGSLSGELAAFRARWAQAKAERPKGDRIKGDRAKGEWPQIYGSEERRARKVYRITPEGEALFFQLLAESGDSKSGGGPDDDRAFNMRLAFARHMAAEARLGLLERRRAALVVRLARSRAAGGTDGERWDRYTRSMAEHSTEATERDISWIDRLIAAERADEPGSAEDQIPTNPQLQGSET